MITLFFLCYNITSVYTIMDKERLKLIVRNLELLVDGLKAEVYSDPSAYIDTSSKTRTASYIEQNDDDGDPD